jgi:hypothetical protein
MQSGSYLVHLFMGQETSTLKGKGITPASRHHVGTAYTVGDFKESVAKMKRCESLIVDLEQWRREEQSRPPTKVTEQDMANEADRARDWAIRSVTTAIDEITRRNEFVGSYFRRALRTENGRFKLDLSGTLCSKELMEFSTGLARK